MPPWYWVIPNMSTLPKPLVADAGSLGKFDEWDFRSGRLIRNWPGEAWVRATRPENDGVPDDVLQTFLPLLIFSIRLQKALSEMGIGDVQYLPLTVQGYGGCSLNGFAIANILAVRDALAVDQSRVTRFREDWIVPERRGEISGIMKAVLIGSSLDGADIIRLVSYPAPVYVSETFRQVFMQGGFTGLGFVKMKVI